MHKKVRSVNTCVIIACTIFVGGIAQAEQLVLRSGNIAGPPGTEDPVVHVLAGPANSGFPNPFTAEDFEAARVGPSARVTSINGNWISSLPSDSAARWVNNTGESGSGSTALYAVEFLVPHVAGAASLELHYAVDNYLGQPQRAGVYVNGIGLPETNQIGGLGQEFNFSADITALVQSGNNTLYLYDYDFGWDAGIIFSATITLDDAGSVPISSSADASAYGVNGALVEQLDFLNTAPPAFDSSWLPVARHPDFHQRAAFLCSPPLGLTAVGGACVLIPAPPSVDYDVLESNTEIRVFQELANLALSGGVLANFSEPGTYDEEPDLPSGAMIPAGTVVTSHLVHFDTAGNERWIRTGSVTFDSDILGVCITPNTLAASDLSLGLPGTTYPLSTQREVELGAGSESSLVLSADRRTLTVTLLVESWNDQVRIITQGGVTDPLQQSYLDAESYLSGADEVTLDNCGSAFYRFTFNLPPFENPALLGQANQDDIAVLYLNGHRISPELLLTDAYGVDRTDGTGAPLLSAPTTDAFSTTEASFFVRGENELVFGVCGDAGPSEPTGLEFVATVSFDSLDVTAAPEPELGSTPVLLGAPSPNPANGALNVAFEMPSTGHVRVRVFDVAGRLVATLIDETVPAGARVVQWDARGKDHRTLASGAYCIRLEAMGRVESRKVLILK